MREIIEEAPGSGRGGTGATGAAGTTTQATTAGGTPALWAAVAVKEVPAWGELEKLLGQRFDAAEVTAFAAKYGLKRYYKFDSGGLDNNEGAAFSLLYRSDRINRVIVRMGHATGDPFAAAPVYGGAMPGGVVGTDLAADVVRKMGEPTWRASADNLYYAKPPMIFVFDDVTHKLVEIDLDAKAVSQRRRGRRRSCLWCRRLGRRRLSGRGSRTLRRKRRWGCLRGRRRG